jgi:hypothetical protein
MPNATDIIERMRAEMAKLRIMASCNSTATSIDYNFPI